jgi:hypothetical protein
MYRRIRRIIPLVLFGFCTALASATIAGAGDSDVSLKVSKDAKPFVFQGGDTPVVTVKYTIHSKSGATCTAFSADGFGTLVYGTFTVPSGSVSGTATTPVWLLPLDSNGRPYQTFYLTCDGVTQTDTAHVKT